LNLLDNQTLWAFVSGSDEDQYIGDIVFGLACLHHRQITSENIIIFIDKPKESKYINNLFGDTEVYCTHEMLSVFRKKSVRKVVVIVTGHGNEKGIEVLSAENESTEIKPYQLIGMMKEIETLRYGLIVLGQCYAGTFNFLEGVNQTSQLNDYPSSEISIIGATDLHISMSATMNLSTDGNLDNFTCYSEWTANLFIFFFLYHTAFPEDTDGDGYTTVIDTYKIAGIKANKILIQSKQEAFLLMYRHSMILENKGNELKGFSMTQEIIDKAQEDYWESSALVLSSQNPWILNPDLARRLIM
jgi:hypothetical protein